MKALLNEDFTLYSLYTEDKILQNPTFFEGKTLIDVTEEEASQLVAGWKYENNVWVAPIVEPVVVVPLIISRMKFKMQLLIMGITFQSIIDAINGISIQYMSNLQKQLAVAKLETATHFERYNQDLIFIAQVMEIPDEQVDTIFIEGNKLE